MKLCAIGFLAFLMWNSHAQDKESMKKATCIEVVTFSPIENVAPTALEEAMKSTYEIIKTFDGFVGRTTAMDEKGTFIDVVYWESKEKALKAAEQVMQLPEVAKNFTLIDPKSIVMKHYEIFARE
ncbi:hypothetical protein [Allomuricauda sp. d1]|uniref:hypothetical protein n=1 Tax=Allomuricauda sp. d1 TaxID=3136725 RepID=UPI0031DF8D02